MTIALLLKLGLATLRVIDEGDDTLCSYYNESYRSINLMNKTLF